MGSYPRFLRVFPVVLAVAALVVLCPGADAAILMTISTKMEVTEIRVSGNPDEGTDDNISKSMLRAIRRKFRGRYHSFHKINSTVGECRLGKDTEFTLHDGRKLIIRVVGYQPAEKVVDFKVQTEDNICAVSIKSGQHWIALMEKDKEPVVIVITPTLLQIHKP